MLACFINWRCVGHFAQFTTLLGLVQSCQATVAPIVAPAAAGSGEKEHDGTTWESVQQRKRKKKKKKNVPGNTPFLVSNRVLKGLKVLVDPWNICLRFHDEPDRMVRLRECRKGLMCVRFEDLLGIPGNNEQCLFGETKAIQTKTDSSSNNTHTRPVDMHELAASEMNCERIQNAQKYSRAAHEKTQADRACKPLVPRHGAAILHDCRALRGGGREPHDSGSDGPQVQVQDTSTYSKSGGMGKGDSPIRKARTVHFSPSLPEGSGVCHMVDQKDGPTPQPGEFPELREGHDEERSSSEGPPRCSPASAPSDGPFPRGIPACSMESGEHTSAELDPQEGCPIRPTAHGDGGTRRADPTNQDPRADKSRSSSRTETDQAVVNPTVNPKFDPRDEALLSQHEKSEHKDGLPNSCEREVMLKEKSQNAQSAKHPETNRPPVLLEVYCEENSQLAHQFRAKGGLAYRFTRRDGDLSTEEGVRKLWTCVHFYEPDDIWVSPDCGAWGNFSRLNMPKATHPRENLHEKRDRPNSFKALQ